MFAPAQKRFRASRFAPIPATAAIDFTPCPVAAILPAHGTAFDNLAIVLQIPAMPSDRSSSVGTLLVHSVSFAFDSFSKSKMLPRAEASAAVRSASEARTVAKSRAKPCERSRSASSFVVQSFSFAANRCVSCSISVRAEATAVMLSESSARMAARLPLFEPRSAVSLVVHSFSLASNRFVSCAIFVSSRGFSSDTICKLGSDGCQISGYTICQMV